MKQAMSGVLIVLFLVTMAALRWGPGLLSQGWESGYRFDRRGKTATRHLDGDIFTDVKNIDVENRYGTVHVEVTSDIPRWSWDLTCWAKTAQLADRLTRQIEMRVDQQSGRSSWTLVLPPWPDRQLRGVESTLTLSVPASVKVRVNNRHGDSEILGVQGGTVARCQHGKVQLSDLAGTIDAETSYAPLSAERIHGGKLANLHGSIAAADVEGDLEARNLHGAVNVSRVEGRLKVYSQHGSVAARGIDGPAEIETCHAGIQLDDLRQSAHVRNRHGRVFGRRLHGNIDVRNEYNAIDLEANCAEVVCRNQHGKIKLVLADPRLRKARAETSYADLELEVSESLSPKIEAQTRYGSIKSAFPTLTMGTGANSFQGLDESAVRITLKNEHGNIRVRKSSGGRSED